MSSDIVPTSALRFKVNVYEQKIRAVNAPLNRKNLNVNAAPVETSVNDERGAAKALFYSGEDNFQHVTAGNKVNVNTAKFINEPAIEIFELAKKKKISGNKSELDEELESSIIFPSYFNPRLKNKLVESWRNIVSGQAFTGSWLELRALRWSARNGPITELRDCNRRTVQSIGSGVFKALCTPSQILGGKFNGRGSSYLYLKSRFTLARVNADNNSISGKGKTWKGLDGIAKGTTWGEPDVILREIKPDGSIQLSIFEFKIGYGKSSDSGAKATEWNQLTRIKRNLELLIDEWIAASGGAKAVKQKYPQWKRPVIKLYFVGWSAPSAARVELTRPTNYDPPSGYEVVPLNGDGFGVLTGMNSAFITKLIEELNYARAAALAKAIQEIQQDPEYVAARANYERNMMRQLALARQLPMKPVSEVSNLLPGNKPRAKAKANASGAGQVAAQEEVLVNLMRKRGASNANFVIQSALGNPQAFTKMYAEFIKRFVSVGGTATNTPAGRMRSAILKAREGKSPKNANWKSLNFFNSVVTQKSRGK